MDCSPPGSPVHDIFQARILEWVAISFSGASSQPRDQTQVSWLAGEFFTAEMPGKPPVEWCVSFTLGFGGVDAFSGKELGKDSPGRTSRMSKGPGMEALRWRERHLTHTVLLSHVAPFPSATLPSCSQEFKNAVQKGVQETSGLQEPAEQFR